MLTILGFAMIATFLVLIMMKKMSPIAALVLIPALFCVFVGKGAHLGDYVIEGVGNLAPTAAMLNFTLTSLRPVCPNRCRAAGSAINCKIAAVIASVWQLST